MYNLKNDKQAEMEMLEIIGNFLMVPRIVCCVATQQPHLHAGQGQCEGAAGNPVICCWVIPYINPASVASSVSWDVGCPMWIHVSSSYVDRE